MIDGGSLPWTGIGGLPLADGRAAVVHVLTHYPAMPFLPEPATADAGMLADALPRELARASHAGFGVRLDHLGAEDAVLAAFASPRERVAGTPLATRARELAALFGEIAEGVVLKGQLAGPVTLLRCVRDAGGIPLWAYPDLRELVAVWCAELARELAYILLESADDVTVWLDEPGLGLAGIEDDGDAVLDALSPSVTMLRDLEVAPGVHCCAEPPLPLLERLALDWIHVDVVRHRCAVTAQGACVARLLDRGTRLVLGCVPVLPDAGVPTPPEMAAEIAAAASRPLADLLPRLALAPTCGTMLAPPGREVAIAGELARWARRMGEA